jgi:serine/threonine protein kinase
MTDVIRGSEEAAEPPPPPPLEAGLKAGSRIAGYRIQEQIGRGGMAVVFRALDERLGRQVAVKVLAPEFAGDEAFRWRFIHESRAAAAVDHPNIIPIYEAGEFDGLLFIAMRYVDGGDVTSLLAEQGRLAPEQATEIITPVASALDKAHAAGLVHRDVKPSNMLLDSRSGKSRHVYLADFGLTKFAADDDSSATRGWVMGTAGYMAPEQIEGHQVDGRADQYGLACSAFAMLSGSPPFPDHDMAAAIAAVMTKPPPALTSRRPDLPPEADEVFARSLARSPEGRFASCGAFAAALAAALGRRPRRPDEVTARAQTLNIPLKPSFRYIHEPSRAGEEAFAPLGNDPLMAQLESRLEHSRGGTFLITGFRGVGKSTLVLRVLDELEGRRRSSDWVLPVVLSVARSTTTERLLFAIVRRVFEKLSDSGALESLPAETRHALLVAYMRTSLAFKETQSEARERSAGVGLSLGPGKLVRAAADFAVPTVSMAAKRSHSLATEAAFLAYSETDVEYDLMRIVDLVDRKPGAAAGRRSWWHRLRIRRSDPDMSRLHLVIVLDEVDKLTAGEAGMATVEELLSGIKNVLTMPGAHFLIVAGPDLHDRAIRDMARGNGVYESVFGWRLYVPCIWDAPERLIADIVSDHAVVDPSLHEVLVHYLRFKARGVPRRLLQEVNGYVAWEDNRPHLRIGAKDMERVEFYARLEQILRDYIERGGRKWLFPVPIDEDRWRLGSYYVVDWVLRREGEPFTASDLLREGEDAEFDPLLRIARRDVDRLLDHLARYQILEVLREMNATATVYGDVAESSEKVFRLAEEVRQTLYGFAARHESERAARDVALAATGVPAAYSPGPVAAPFPGAPPPRPSTAATGAGWRPPQQAAAAWSPPPQPPAAGPQADADADRDEPYYAPTMMGPVTEIAPEAAPAGAAPPRGGRFGAGPFGADAQPGPASPPAYADGRGAVEAAGPGRDRAGSPDPAAPAAPAAAEAAHREPPADVVLVPPPRVIGGRYQLGELIGSPGLSSVYKGDDLITGRQVVVKLLRPTLCDDPVAMARFRREADIAKRLSHPQIARTYDVLEGPDNPALILEWLNGPNLEAMVRDEGPMSPVQVAAIGQILASALEYIASERVVRLDLKPSNIVMADRGPVITDLGIAVRVGTGAEPITAMGQFVGTPAYMAPELIEGSEADPRADIYALGLVLYFCLAGKNPWANLPNALAVIRAVVNTEQVDVSGLAVSAEFRAALARAMARNLGNRFPEAAAFRNALLKTPELRSIGAETGPTGDPVPQPSRSAEDNDPIL